MDKLGRHLYRVGTFSLNETERVLLGDGKVICRIARQSTFHADSDWCHATKALGRASPCKLFFNPSE